jgi:acetyl esterase/lipase
MRIILLALFLVTSATLIANEQSPSIMTAEELGVFGNPPADTRLSYGEDALQFVDLRLPAGAGPHPVVILIHGGCWLSQYDIVHIGKLAQAFADNGIASWTVEYRRVGNEGGGWPGTFQDIAQSAALLHEHAEEYSLDTANVIVSGHSAGGHMALWLAAREKFKDSPLFSDIKPVQLKGVLALAPAPDLAYLHEKAVCGEVIDKLMGGSPTEHPARYAIASGTEIAPIGLPQILVIGHHDKNWKGIGYRYYEAAKAKNDDVRAIEALESGHFEMIDPNSSTWPLVIDAARELLAR